MAWRTVFIVEYLGPLLIHPLVLLVARPRLYAALYPYVREWVPAWRASLSLEQVLSCNLLMLHFAKREVETVFVHRFSHATMPARHLVRNAAYYWATAGLLAALEMYAPFSPAAAADSEGLTFAGTALFLAAELLNLNVHLYLAGLRSPGGTERRVPAGWAFGLVTCPNYTSEIAAWVGLVLVSRSPSVALSISIGSYFMYTWARQKERAYRREFGDKYKKKRFVLLPGLL